MQLKGSSTRVHTLYIYYTFMTLDETVLTMTGKMYQWLTDVLTSANIIFCFLWTGQKRCVSCPLCTHSCKYCTAQSQEQRDIQKYMSTGKPISIADGWADRACASLSKACGGWTLHYSTVVGVISEINTHGQLVISGNLWWAQLLAWPCFKKSRLQDNTDNVCSSVGPLLLQCHLFKLGLSSDYCNTHRFAAVVHRFAVTLVLYLCGVLTNIISHYLTKWLCSCRITSLFKA